MSTTYKALQNKAMHNGVYIGYAIARDGQWTTNGQIMVKHVATPEELKPLKNQIDKRVDGSAMVDMTFVLDKLDAGDTAVTDVDNAEDWMNAAGLQLTRSTGYHKPTSTTLDVSVQSVYLDYANALFEHDLKWWMTPFAVFGARNDEVVVVIATVNKIKGDK